MTTTTTPYLPSLPTTTIMPTTDDLFEPYWTDLYSQMADTINRKDEIFYPMAITNTAQNILNLPRFGSFILCVSGIDEGLPAYVFVLTKSRSTTTAGTFATLGSQAGTIAPWVAATLTVSSTTTNFQINHSVANTTGNFNLRVIGTQTVG